MKPMPFWMWLTETVAMIGLVLAVYWTLYWIGLPLLVCALVGIVVTVVLAHVLLTIVKWEGKR